MIFRGVANKKCNLKPLLVPYWLTKSTMLVRKKKKKKKKENTTSLNLVFSAHKSTHLYRATPTQAIHSATTCDPKIGWMDSPIAAHTKTTG